MSEVELNPRLYVGNLSPSVSEDDLRRLFSQAGPVTEVKLMLDPSSQQSRGFGFVTMASPESAAVALRDLHCHSLGGRYITVTPARPVQEPKGTMREGFDLANATPFRPAAPRGKPRRHSPRNPGRKGRGR